MTLKNLEKLINFLDKEEKRKLKDFLQIGVVALGIGFLMTQLKFENLIGKIGLIGKEPLSNGLFFGGIYGNIAAGLFSGFTNRYWASTIYFAASFTPNLIDAYKNEELLLNMKTFLAKTAAVYGGWALGVVGKNLYKQIKEHYKKTTPL